MAGWFLLAFLRIIISLSKYHKVLWINKIYIQLLIIGLAGVYWEYVAPMYVPDNVSDPLDLIAYMAGGALYTMILMLRKMN